MASALLRWGIRSDCSAVHNFTAACKFVLFVYHISEHGLCKMADAPNIELKIGQSLGSKNDL